ncbi:MAG: threonine/serine exporter family protein [Clostridia bacterium]|nr:threonine/serine exporter family protein [Clostridia bacterium]
MKEFLIIAISGAVGTAGFALLFRINKKRLPFAILGGMLCSIIYLIMTKFCPYEFVQMMVPSAFATAYAEVFARILKAPSSTLLVPSIIVLVPGKSLYYTMNHVVAWDTESFSQTAYLTIELAGGIAAGIMLVSAVVYHMVERKNRKKILAEISEKHIKP